MYIIPVLETSHVLHNTHTYTHKGYSVACTHTHTHTHTYTHEGGFCNGKLVP